MSDEAVLTSTLKLCFEQKHEKYQNFLSENFHFLVVKFSVYLNRRVFVMALKGRNLFPFKVYSFSKEIRIDFDRVVSLESVLVPLKA